MVSRNYRLICVSKIIFLVLAVVFAAAVLPGAGTVFAADAGADSNQTTGTVPPVRFADDRVIVKVAGISSYAVTSQDTSAPVFDFDGLPDFDKDIAVTGIELLNPSFDSGGAVVSCDDSGSASYAVSGTQNNVFALTLAETGEDAVLSALEILSQNPFIEIAEPDYYYEFFTEPAVTPLSSVLPNDPLLGRQYALQRINIPHAWNTTTGSKNVVVGILDTGFDGTHPDLAGNLWLNPNPNEHGDVHGFDFVQSRGGVPYDNAGHGTRMAGVIGAAGNNGTGITGVNWNVSLAWLGISNNDANNTQASYIISALNYANHHNIPVTNNSYGSFAYSQLLFEAIGNYNGLFVAAAGNFSSNNDVRPVYPAGYTCPNIVSVASVEPDDRLSSFSNYGASSVHIAAPGRNILTTDIGGKYISKDGTSYSCAYVSGIAALMLDVNPSLNATELKNILISTARRVSALNTRGGFGIADAHAAVLTAQALRSAGFEGTARDFVERLYRYVLDREPHADEVGLWVSRLTDGYSGTELAAAFFFSDEFLGKNTDDSTFTDILYAALLGRTPDFEGKQFWQSSLANGVSRQSVFRNFTASIEFGALCAGHGIYR